MKNKFRGGCISVRTDITDRHIAWYPDGICNQRIKPGFWEKIGYLDRRESDGKIALVLVMDGGLKNQGGYYAGAGRAIEYGLKSMDGYIL